jgi:DivIVA domain-containing protein
LAAIRFLPHSAEPSHLAVQRNFTSPGVSVQPQDIQDRRFTTAFRGYDPTEVRQFLAHIAGLYGDMTSRLERAGVSVTDTDGAVVRAVAPVAEPTEPLVDAAEFASLEELRMQARREAEDLMSAARSEAQTIVSRANDEAARTVLRARAESRGKPSAEMNAAIEAALSEVPSDPEQAREQAKLMISEAKAVRERILTDLAKRRRTAHVQLEQLRVAREKLLETFRDARRVVEDASRDLSTAEVEARLAAETAGRRVNAESMPSVAELESELFGGNFVVSSSRAIASPIVDAAEESGVVAAALSVGTSPVSGGDPVVDVSSPIAAEPTPSVDDLFARLRAERTESADRAREVMAELATTNPSVEVKKARPKKVKPESVAATDDAAARVVSAAAPSVDTGHAMATETVEGPTVVLDLTPAAPTSPDRTEVTDLGQDPADVADLLAQRLARAIKRHLRDEQGAALVALRTARGMPHVDALLGLDDEQRARLAETIDVASHDAGASVPQEGRNAVVASIADTIRTEISTALVRVSDGQGDVSELPEDIAAAYRSWTIERLDALVRDSSHAAA